MEGLFGNYKDSNPETGKTTGGGAREVYRKKMKKKKKKKVTSKDIPGNGMARRAGEAIEDNQRRRKAILDAL